MKNISFYCKASILIVILSLQLNSFGSQKIDNSNTSIENSLIFEEEEIYSAFEEVSELVSLVNGNDNLNCDQMVSMNPILFENVDLNTSLAFNQEAVKKKDFGPLIVGCLFGNIGVAYYIFKKEANINDIKESAKGCAISTITYAIYLITSYLYR